MLVGITTNGHAQIWQDDVESQGWLSYGLVQGHAGVSDLGQGVLDPNNRTDLGSQISLGAVVQSATVRRPQLVLGVDLDSRFEALPSAWAGESTNIDDLAVSGVNAIATWYVRPDEALSLGFARRVAGGDVQLINGGPIVVDQGGQTLNPGDEVDLGQHLDAYRLGYQLGSGLLSASGRLEAVDNGWYESTRRSAIRFQAGYGRWVSQGLVGTSTPGQYRVSNEQQNDGLLLGIVGGWEGNEWSTGWRPYATGGIETLLGRRGVGFLEGQAGAVCRFDQIDVRVFAGGSVQIDGLYDPGDPPVQMDTGAWSWLIGASIGFRF